MREETQFHAMSKGDIWSQKRNNDSIQGSSNANIFCFNTVSHNHT